MYTAIFCIDGIDINLSMFDITLTKYFRFNGVHFLRAAYHSDAFFIISIVNIMLPILTTHLCLHSHGQKCCANLYTNIMLSFTKCNTLCK